MNLGVLIIINVCMALLIGYILNRRLTRSILDQTFMKKVRREIEGMITELNRTTDRSIQMIEDHVTRLQQLLRRADRTIGQLHDLPQDAPNSAPAETPPPDETVPESSPDLPTHHELDQQQVLELYHRGLIPKAIASRLGASVGEIELILSMFRLKP